MKTVLFFFSVYDRLFNDYKELLKAQGFENFYGVAYGRSPFISEESYKSVIYVPDYFLTPNKLTSDEESKLAQAESDAGLTISDCIHADRHIKLIERDKRERGVKNLILDIVHLIELNKVDVVISEGCDDLISMFFSAYLHRSKKTTFLFPIPARLGSKMHFSNHRDTRPLGFESRFHNYDIEGKDYIVKFIDEYVNNKKQPYYISSSLNYRSLSFNDLMKFFRYLSFYSKNKNSLHVKNNPLNVVSNRLKRVLNKFIYEGLTKYEINYGVDKYFVFPLQFIPEAATLVQGSKLNDMVVLIEVLSKSLPLGYKLAVKEHLPCIGRRDTKLYKAIKNFHNVELVSESLDVHNLVKYSAGVLTISSSMGLEAMLLGKPVGVLGKSFYSFSRNSYTIHNIYEVDKIILMMINHKFCNEDLKKFIGVLLDSSFEAYMHPEEYTDLTPIPEIKPYLNRFGC